MTKMMDHIKVYRTCKPTMRFTPNSKYGRYCHVTRYGTVYGIFMSHKDFKPAWIGRYIPKEGAWVTWEKELRVNTIQFPNGGRYVFP